MFVNCKKIRRRVGQDEVALNTFEGANGKGRKKYEDDRKKIGLHLLRHATPQNYHCASTLNFAVDIFPAWFIFIAMIQGPDMMKFIVALYLSPFNLASVM